MNAWRLALGEMAHRKLNAALMCVSVAVAAGCVIGSLSLLSAHDVRTEAVIEHREAATRREMARLEDDTRIIMRRMGHNVLVLHRDQDIAELHALGHPTVAMPQDYADRLAAAGIQTLNHLLPILQQRVHWPEAGQQVLLTGIRGQVAIAGVRQDRKPITQPVGPGAVVLGSALARRLAVAAGSTVTLMGEQFRVERVNPQRGNSDDIGVWVELAKVQQWLDMPGQINGILALECVCDLEALGKIQQEIAAILPDTQIFEFSSIVHSRAEARQRAAETHRTAVAAELAHRMDMRRERQRLAEVLSPVVVAAACVGVALLVYGNARDRRAEIGVLRALGVREGQVVSVFMIKAVLTGLLGGAIGTAAGLLTGGLAGGGDSAPLPALVSPAQVAMTVAMGPVLAALSSLLPAMSAARRDPAAVLCED